MIEGRNKILAWFESTAMPAFTICHLNGTASGNWVYKNPWTESTTNAQALADLKKWLDITTSGKFTIVAADTNERIPAKGAWREDISLSAFEDKPGSAQAVSIGGIPDGYVKMEDVTKMVKDSLDAYKKDQELEASKKRIAELEQENKELNANDPWTRIAGVAADLLPHIMPNLKAQVAGIPPAMPPVPEPATEDDAVELTEEEETRLGNALAVFREVDPDWIGTLEKMANKARTTPGIINTLKAFL